MAPILLWLVMVLCLLISVVKYVMGVILKLSFPSTRIQKDYTYQPTVSVLMPCFNEGKTVYETIESIVKSNYPNDKFEVIAQDDCSVDDSYEWMLKPSAISPTFASARAGTRSIAGRHEQFATRCSTRPPRSLSRSIRIAFSMRTRLGS